MKRQSGFTLVEIAIVLVVIGLLLGGVLKGQELVLNSQIRNAINEFNNVASAVFAYQDRYRQIPGDDDTANARWGVGVTDGNSSRVIDGDWDTGTNAEETGVFWQHLRNDNLVSGSRLGDEAYELPRNSFDGDIGVQDAAFAAAINGPVICQDNVLFKPASIIDTRIDDENGDLTGSTSGNLRAGTDARAAAAATYADDGTRYTLCREL